METSNQTTQTTVAQVGEVDYAAELRQYQRYGRGRSMKKFCEDEGYEIRIRFNNGLIMNRRGGDVNTACA